jgi:ribosomal protein S21
MIIVELKDGESIEKALKQVRSRMYFTPPSVGRREEIKKAVRRQNYIETHDLQ